jgi:hypothetical protein
MKICFFAVFAVSFAAGAVACSSGASPSAQEERASSHSPAASELALTRDASTVDDAALLDAGVAGDASADGGLAPSDASTGDAKAPQAATWSSAFALLSARCVQCHDSTDPANEMGFGDKDAAYATLVGREAQLSACSGLGQTIVVPGDPTASLLYRKLARTQECGSAMPRGRSAVPFTATELEIIASWIAGGAKNN